MPDLLDKATERQEIEMARILACHLSRAVSEDELAQLLARGRACAVCSLPIPTARLKANPHAMLCIDCQMESER